MLVLSKEEKAIVLDALLAKRAALARGKAKTNRPAFKVVYEAEEMVLAGLVMKVEAMEVKK